MQRMLADCCEDLAWCHFEKLSLVNTAVSSASTGGSVISGVSAGIEVEFPEAFSGFSIVF
jgi:hypothetical protein